MYPLCHDWGALPAGIRTLRGSQGRRGGADAILGVVTRVRDNIKRRGSSHHCPVLTRVLNKMLHQSMSASAFLAGKHALDTEHVLPNQLEFAHDTISRVT